MLSNVAKIIAMCYVAFWLADKPLITFGDAVSSFLERPDSITEGACLVTNEYFWRVWNDAEDDFYRQERLGDRALSFHRVRRYLRKAAHNGSWFVLASLYLISLVIIGVFLRFSIAKVRGRNDIADLWALGFGKPHEENLIGGNGWHMPSITAAVLIANLPQPLLSFLYLLFNGLLTAMLSAREWSHYASERKPLRVSTPRGSQRSTYFLQLPYRFALPLMVVSGALHWFVSQSLFLANITTIRRDGSIDVEATVSTCGYSPIAMICTLCVGGCMLVLTVCAGLWRVSSDIPFVGSCSAAISAACHPPEHQGNAHLLPVQWGVVPGMECGDIGHFSFSAEEVEQPREGALYA